MELIPRERPLGDLVFDSDTGGASLRSRHIAADVQPHHLREPEVSAEGQ